MTNDDKNILWLDLFDFLAYGKKIKLLSAIEKGEDLRLNFLNSADGSISISLQKPLPIQEWPLHIYNLFLFLQICEALYSIFPYVQRK